MLTAIEHLRDLREMVDVPRMPEMARVALLKRESHLLMLAPESVVFHLFNPEASDNSRARMARALIGHLDQWIPGEFLIDPVSLNSSSLSVSSP